MKRNRHVALFIAVLFSISIVTGYIYGINNYYDLTDYIKNLAEPSNFFFYHGFILFVFLFSTLSLLGIVIEATLIGFEGISIGYTLSIFYANFKLNGLFYGFLTLLINKFFFLLALFYLFLVSSRYIKKNIQNIVGVNKDYVEYLIKPLIKKYICIGIFLIIYDIVLYFFGNGLLNYLTFML